MHWSHSSASGSEWESLGCRAFGDQKATWEWVVSCSIHAATLWMTLKRLKCRYSGEVKLVRLVRLLWFWKCLRYVVVKFLKISRNSFCSHRRRVIFLGPAATFRSSLWSPHLSLRFSSFAMPFAPDALQRHNIETKISQALENLDRKNMETVHAIHRSLNIMYILRLYVYVCECF